VADQLRELATGMYVLWLVAVVLVVVGRYTAFPTLPGTVTGVVLGATVFALFGARHLLRALSGRLGR
jgi:hypothetical protein